MRKLKADVYSYDMKIKAFCLLTILNLYRVSKVRQDSSSSAVITQEEKNTSILKTAA